MEPGLESFLKALERNTRSNDELREAVDRLSLEFKALRANATPEPSDTPADRIASVAGDALSQALSEAFGGSKRRKKR